MASLLSQHMIAIVLTACGIETGKIVSPCTPPSIFIAIVLTACGIETAVEFYRGAGFTKVDCNSTYRLRY